MMGSSNAAPDASAEMVRHFLASLAYRTHKALQDAPTDFADLDVGFGVRTPHALLAHMNDVLTFCRGILTERWEELVALPWPEEIDRFHGLLADIDDALVGFSGPETDILKRLLQGPLSDAMSHAGQFAMLRRLHGASMRGENFFAADIRTGRTGPDQPDPAEPDDE